MEKEKETNLGITRICIKHIAEEFTCDSDTGDDESVDIIRVDMEDSPPRIATATTARSQGESGHPIKIHQEREEYKIGGRTIFEDPQEVGLEGDGRDVPRMKGQGDICGGIRDGRTGSRDKDGLGCRCEGGRGRWWRSGSDGHGGVAVVGLSDVGENVC